MVHFVPLDQVFPVEGTPRDEWRNTLSVQCGWNQTWDPPTVPRCRDARGCQPPPARNERIWGSFEDSADKSLDLGAMYWYNCREEGK